jgi:hypothetical protein
MERVGNYIKFVEVPEGNSGVSNGLLCERRRLGAKDEVDHLNAVQIMWYKRIGSIVVSPVALYVSGVQKPYIDARSSKATDHTIHLPHDTSSH